MFNLPFILMLFFGCLFIVLFVVSTLSITGRLPHSEKIMQVFNIKLFDDPIQIKPETSLAIMGVLTVFAVIVEIISRF